MRKNPQKDPQLTVKAQTRRSGTKARRQHDLHDRYLSFESLISDLLARFVKIEDTQTDLEIEDAIWRICLFLGLDQGLIIQWGQDGSLPRPTHSWTVSGGLPPPVSPGTEVVPWVHGQAMLGNIVMFSRVEDLPREAEKDKEFFSASGRKSLISLPLKIGGRVIGVLVFAGLHTEILWPDEVVRRLQMIGDVFAGVLDRKKRELELERRLGFEQLLSELSARFVNIAPERVDGEIEQSLRQVLELFQVDRCALLKTLPERKSWQIDFASYAEGIPPLPEKTDLPLSLFPWVASQVLDQHRVVFFRTPDDLPPEAFIDKQTYHAWKIRSSLTIPILIGGQTDYALAINAVSHERIWSENYISRLRLLGEVFVNVLERRRIDLALLESEERLSLAADSAGAMLWSLNIDSGQVWTTKKAKEFFGFVPDREMDLESFLGIVYPEDRERLRQSVEETMRSGKDNSVEYRIVRPDGSIRWVLSRGRPYPASPGEPARLMGVSIDVTERKHAEETLKKSEAALRTSQQDLKRLAGRLISAQEEELRRLSRELHDDLTQKLAVLAIEAGKLEQELKKSPDSSSSRSKKISEIKDQLIRVSEEVHQISRQIHPSILDDLGLVRAIESECTTFLRKEKINVTFVREDVFPVIPKDIALCLYRIVQESLKNIAKYSEAKKAEISLKSADSNILLAIKDNGIGFDLKELQQKRGLGLASMRERVQLVRGTFSVESRPGHGTVINVRVSLAGNGE